jgi:hypothetical protein
MHQKTLRNWIAIVAGVVLTATTLLLGNGALGASSDISGSWDIEANRFTGTLVIDSVNGKLSGSIFNESIEGFYIPGSRRIVFVRQKQGIPYQLYEGTVSSSGQQMDGEFHVWNSTGGASMDGLDFKFSAKKR